MSTNLARLHRTGSQDLAIATPIEEFRPLDKYTGGLADDLIRVPWLATISAGFKNDKGYPQASRKRDAEWIHMTAEDVERAPGLHAALEAGGFRALDVAIPFDDPQLFLQQRFEKRSATRLEAYGDEHQLIEIKVQYSGQGEKRTVTGVQRIEHPAGSIEYAALVRECNVCVSFFFTLARWRGRDPNIYFPPEDGLGVYRLRFTSRNSLRELLASLRQISQLTAGRLAGIPLRLSLDWREVADPMGTRREIGVWKLRFMPPQGIELTPAVWQELKQKALAEGDLLRQVPAPSVESIDDATEIMDANLDAPEQHTLDSLETGPPCDAEFYQRAWFARVKDSPLDADEARADFVERFARTTTGELTSSLSEFLRTATEEQAAGLIAEAGRYLGTLKTRQGARRYDEIFGEAVVDPPPPGDDQRRRQELWAENRKLCDEARTRGLTGKTIVTTAGVDVLTEANRELRERIENYDLDQQALRASQVPF
jgi:hypothetical protein